MRLSDACALHASCALCVCMLPKIARQNFRHMTHTHEFWRHVAHVAHEHMLCAHNHVRTCPHNQNTWPTLDGRSKDRRIHTHSFHSLLFCLQTQTVVKAGNNSINCCSKGCDCLMAEVQCYGIPNCDGSGAPRAFINLNTFVVRCGTWNIEARLTGS